MRAAAFAMAECIRAIASNAPGAKEVRCPVGMDACKGMKSHKYESNRLGRGCHGLGVGSASRCVTVLVQNSTQRAHPFALQGLNEELEEQLH